VNAGKEGALVSLEFGAPGMTAENPRLADGVEITAGEGPLPPGAEDGFDPNVLLDPSTGKLVYKTVAKKAATKTQAAGNGTKLASAGVGVYFGPGDSRFVTFLEQPRFGQVILTHA
jgi:ribonuclease HI